ncbi:hypothetical protein D3C76_1601830 [compost metagenome]
MTVAKQRKAGFLEHRFHLFLLSAPVIMIPQYSEFAILSLHGCQHGYTLPHRFGFPFHHITGKTDQIRRLLLYGLGQLLHFLQSGMKA